MKHYNTNMLLCRDFPSLLLNLALNHKCWLATNFYNFPHFPHFLPSSSFLYNQTLDKQPSCFATLHSYSDIFILASHISIVCVWLLSYLICLLDKITLYYHHFRVSGYPLTWSTCSTRSHFAIITLQCLTTLLPCHLVLQVRNSHQSTHSVSGKCLNSLLPVLLTPAPFATQHLECLIFSTNPKEIAKMSSRPATMYLPSVAAHSQLVPSVQVTVTVWHSLLCPSSTPNQEIHPTDNLAEPVRQPR